MFPTALGCLVSSKAYGVARAATVPRLLPAGLTLVKANSRISLAGVVGAADLGADRRRSPRRRARSGRCATPSWSSPAPRSWRSCCPPRADAHGGDELPVSLRGTQRSSGCPPAWSFALRCNAGLRMLSGFLTMYMAFLLRQYPLARLGAPHHAADRRW